MISFLLLLICFLIAYLFKSYYVIFLIGFLLLSLGKNPHFKRKYYFIPFCFLLLVFINFLGMKSDSLSIHSYGFVSDAKENYYLLSTMKGKYYVYERDNQKEVGDIIQVQGYSKNLSFHHIESQFDFENYLHHKGCSKQLFIFHERVIVKSLIKTKKWQAYLKNHVDESTFQLCRMLFFGRYDDSYLIDKMAMIHFFPLFSLGTFFFHFLFKRLTKKNRGYKLAFILPFFLLRPLRLFWWKLIIEEILIASFQRKNLRISALQKASMSGLILLFINPFNAYQVSFQLTYGLSLTINIINSLLFRKKKNTRRIIIWLLSQLLLMLYEGYAHYEINLLLPLYQVFTPFLIILYLALSCLFFGRQFHLLSLLSAFYYKFIDRLSSLTFTIVSGKISGMIIGLIIFILFLTAFQNAKGKKSPALKATIVALIIFQATPINRFFDKVSFIDVGQGDAILIENRQMTFLIDTGGTLAFDIAKESLIPFFKKKRITQIDYYVSTHNDFDHIGGLESLKRAGYLKRIIEDDDAFPLRLATMTITDLNQFKDRFTDENNRSRVLSFTLLGKSFLCMGDAGIAVEKLLLERYHDLHHDVIKIGHHGSNTSSSYEFLARVRPQIAVISCGYHNIYHHPHREVISRLEKLDIIIRRTDMEGTIVFSDKNLFSFFMKWFCLWYTRLERRNEDALYIVWSSRANT